MLRVVHSLEKIPKESNTKHALLDLSDAGELGYLYGCGPEELCDLPQTMYEVLLLPERYGEGNAELWRRRGIRGDSPLVILTDPLRTGKLHQKATHDAALKLKHLQEQLQSFVTYLASLGYAEIVILTGRTPTALYKCVKKICL